MKIECGQVKPVPKRRVSDLAPGTVFKRNNKFYIVAIIHSSGSIYAVDLGTGCEGNDTDDCFLQRREWKDFVVYPSAKMVCGDPE